MGQVIKLADDETTDAVNALLGRVYETKRQSVALLDEWTRHERDAEMYAGLAPQLTDERKHLRILGDEMKRRGLKTSVPIVQQLLSRPFAMVKAQSDPVFRLCALHRGIKTFTLARCGQMATLVDPALTRILEQVSREDARHVRWADIRIDRSLGPSDGRQANLMLDRIDEMLEGVWLKPWRQLMQARQNHRPLPRVS
ncbi:MAG TPA: hypothetical protein VI759_09330 [Dehalococcoidia bacterium]|nr:hypothetical protein [Dehalococcoidia bacterium]